MAGFSTKNLLGNDDVGTRGFNGISPSLSQQLLDEEENRTQQMKQERNPMTAMRGGAGMNMPSLGLFGAGGSAAMLR